MTEFTNLDLNKSIEDMTEGELRETLSDFMDAHEDNRQAYDTKADEVDEVETEYQEQIEDLEEKVTEYKESRAAEAAEYVNMPSSILAERFSFSELEQIIEEGEASEEFADEEGDNEDDDEPDRLTTFAEREQKGQVDNGEKPANPKFRRSASELLSEKGLSIGGD